MRRIYSNLFKRMLRAYVQTHLGVIGDIVGVYITFKDKAYVLDLIIYQITRKLSADGVKTAIVTFLMQDQGFRQIVSSTIGDIF